MSATCLAWFLAPCKLSFRECSASGNLPWTPDLLPLPHSYTSLPDLCSQALGSLCVPREAQGQKPVLCLQCLAHSRSRVYVRVKTTNEPKNQWNIMNKYLVSRQLMQKKKKKWEHIIIKWLVIKMVEDPKFPGGACMLVEKCTKGNEERSHPLFLNISFHHSLRTS